MPLLCYDKKSRLISALQHEHRTQRRHVDRYLAHSNFRLAVFLAIYTQDGSDFRTIYCGKRRDKNGPFRNGSNPKRAIDVLKLLQK